MANSKQAKKRAKQSIVRAMKNKVRKSKLKTEIKKLHTALESKDLQEAAKLLSSVNAMTSRAKGKGLIHRNTAARKISRLAKKVAAAQKAA